jgi:N-acetylmuramoyl-L-alanine amidase
MYNLYLSPSTQEKNQTVFGKSEETIMNTLADGVEWRLTTWTDQIIVHRNLPVWTLSQIIEDSNKRRPLLHLALHSNAGGGSGTETFTDPKDPNSKEFAELIQRKIVEALELPDRGVKDGAAKNFGEIVHVKATRALVEVFFHDNPADAARYRERFEAVRDAIALGVIEWFGIGEQTELEKLRKFKADVEAAFKRLEV